MENVTVVPAIRLSRMTGGKAPLVIKVIIGGTIAKTLAMGIKVDPANWNIATRSVLKGEPNHGLYNMKIKQEVSRLEAEFTAKSLMGITITKSRAKKIAEGKDPGRDFYKFCDEWIPQKYTNKETIRTYESEVTKLKKHAKELAFGDIDFKFLTGYKKYMQLKLDNKDNTIWKTFKFINTMILDAIKMKGIINDNPFDEFDRGVYKNPDKLGIELSDCDKIEPLCTDETKPVIIRRVATRFLLMCYCGLRFEDAMSFDPAIHVVDGNRIKLKTQKMGVALNMKLYNRLSRIIDLLRQYPKLNLDNKDFNRYLKQVGEYAELGHMDLTCHKGRHTFGGLLAEMEIPEEQAQKLLAHKDIRSTRVYYHIKGKNLDNAMDKMNGL